MTPGTRARRPAALLVLVAAALAVPIATLGAAERVAGGETFTSRRGWFTVRVPRPDTVSGRLFEVKDSWGRGADAFEEASFTIRELGESYHVGIRRLGSQLRLLAGGSATGELTPDALSDAALAVHYGGRLPGPVTVIGTSALATPHGAGLARVNRVQGGSVLQGLTSSADADLSGIAGSAYPGRRSADAVVVTGVVSSGLYVIYASAQNDYLGLDELARERRVSVLRSRVQELLDSLALVKELPTK
jgi:hypothetical protein